MCLKLLFWKVLKALNLGMLLNGCKVEMSRLRHVNCKQSLTNIFTKDSLFPMGIWITNWEKSPCSFNIFMVRMPQKKFSKKQCFILLENVESIPDICKEILQIVQNRYWVVSCFCLWGIFWFWGFDLFLFSLFGWDHVAQGIVQLGFCLMDSFGSNKNGMNWVLVH